MPLIDNLDRLYRTREVADLEGVSTRTLYEHIRAGRFPPPDVPAERRGAPARWYGLTIHRIREQRQLRVNRRIEGAAA